MSDSGQNDNTHSHQGGTTDSTSRQDASSGADRPRAAADSGDGTPKPRRRRGSRGGRNRRGRGGGGGGGTGASNAAGGETSAADSTAPRSGGRSATPASGERQPDTTAAAGPSPKPKIGDSRPAPAAPTERSGGERSGRQGANGGSSGGDGSSSGDGSGGARRRRRRGGRGRSRSKQPSSHAPVESSTSDLEPIELDEEALERRKGRERKGKPVGRYLMAVHVEPEVTQIAVLEGRALIEHRVSRPADDVSQIHGNIYLGRVQNVLPGMEAAFVDIGTPKNAVLYWGDVQYDPDDIDTPGGGRPRIEDVLKARQTIICQVTKNPIAHKGARLTQEVSLPGRFVVLVPNSKTYGISKRLPDKERKRLRSILDKVKPPQHGVIVRTAAENVTSEEIERDVLRLLDQWKGIEDLAQRSKAPALLYREPDMAVRVIREEFNKEYRGVVIDDAALFDEVSSYVRAFTPALADRVELYDGGRQALGLFERHHVHEQLVKALDKKVWLPSGGSLIIEHTEALTVIDVNTGKNVGSRSLEETVFKNNIEAAREIPRQLRLRDIGGIIVIDFVDMEEKRNREEVMKAFREALSHDKTRTQVFDISELGLVQMTRKRIGEGLLESFSTMCEHCEGRGVNLDHDLLGDA
ncbi:MAG: Rne/Rng family ribonuclease [Acidimicrobiales bacterium]|nr:Rne/Rng family ribonuclease [Acidimicrobiales bacterium]